MIEHAFTLETDLFEATTPSPLHQPALLREDFAAWLSASPRARRRCLEPIQEDWAGNDRAVSGQSLHALH
jgi:hypothetical protein